MSNDKQSMKTHLTTATILIGILLLGWATAKIDAVFIGVLITALLVFMYGCIQLTMFRNKGGNNEQQ